MRVSGFLVLMVGLGFVGVIWAIVDVVNRGWSHVPGSTYACGVLGLILAVFALYREFGGQSLITENPEHESAAAQYEEQKRRDGLN
ncbi:MULTISPECIES: hypothetical protein [unclassified Gordonia (in: high G+C Gram-positive bacteria)]|uniref:hypothetical protein n=1 Tax=unclassified Gordonia (in: high G+C Gram-positive bacteria) TaxID=2657482 RepID=UPI001FFF53D9|nr:MULTISPECIES: hypothetical protein [unclassified Gordonia (in: high G+C Gram-positive bacteria)]UQE76321.1 hypothetical protein MYK68_06995 [Gordonia sp. PP30]